MAEGFYPKHQYNHHNEETSGKIFTWFFCFTQKEDMQGSALAFDFNPKVGDLGKGKDVMPAYYFEFSIDREKESAIHSQSSLHPTGTTLRVAKIGVPASPFIEFAIVKNIIRGNKATNIIMTCTTRQAGANANKIIPIKSYYFEKINISSYQIEHSHANTEELGICHMHVTWEKFTFIAKPVMDQTAKGNFVVSVSARDYISDAKIPKAS